MLNNRSDRDPAIGNGVKWVGIKAESKEHNYTIHAKSVILATGGFGANFDLMASLQSGTGQCRM
ncbi:MAG: hypothetical protein ACLVJH_19215 [Faecalibacterium prausnitzii]